MASFDIIDAAGYAYRLLWAERRYLMRLAFVPVMVQIACHSGVMIFGWGQDFIKQALIMLPSYFTEGWLLAHLTRLVFLDQRWPFRPTGDRSRDMAMLQDRAQGIMSGTLFYVVTRFLMAGLLGGVYWFSKQVTPETGDDVPPAAALAAVGMLLFLVWAFRFLWLYIPASLNAPVKDFLIAIRGFSVSFYMMGAWLIALIPLLMLDVFIMSLLLSLSGSLAAVPLPLKIIMEILQALMDLTILMLATAAIAHGIRSMMTRPPL